MRVVFHLINLVLASMILFFLLRALAGSLASFDTSSIVNTEGVPLLEENEFETEGSGNSVRGNFCLFSLFDFIF